MNDLANVRIGNLAEMQSRSGETEYAERRGVFQGIIGGMVVSSACTAIGMLAQSDADSERSDAIEKAAYTKALFCVEDRLDSADRQGQKLPGEMKKIIMQCRQKMGIEADRKDK